MENFDFNIDITDNLGRSALRLAVENEHLEVNFKCFVNEVLFLSKHNIF